jgi:hypothetical protein
VVRRHLVFFAALMGIGACRENRPMADQVEMPTMDSMVAADPIKVDSMLDTMPGGEMARGNDSAALGLLKKKMQ